MKLNSIFHHYKNDWNKMLGGEKLYFILKLFGFILYTLIILTSVITLIYLDKIEFAFLLVSFTFASSLFLVDFGRKIQREENEN